jgi:membrane protein YdbS with pleckstrin-like domain
MKVIKTIGLLFILILVQTMVYFICGKIDISEYGKGMCVAYSAVFTVLIYDKNKD